MIPECVNNGGPTSLVRLAAIPILDEMTPLAADAATALAAWQVRPGAILTVVDPEQTCYRARLVAADAVRPFARLPQPAESRVVLDIYQALPHKERFELVLQKLTELGISRIRPFVSARSATQADRDAGQRKSHRWPEVVLRAARQCRRAMLPELSPVMAWPAVLQLAAQADLKLLLYEGAAVAELGAALRGQRPGQVALVVGPEGGFTPAEVEAARHFGLLPVSFGPRILRTETAAIAAAAVLQYAFGDLG